MNPAIAGVVVVVADLRIVFEAAVIADVPAAVIEAAPAG